MEKEDIPLTENILALRGCLKSRNPLTAKIAKDIRKGRKELNINDIALRTLRHLSALRG